MGREHIMAGWIGLGLLAASSMSPAQAELLALWNFQDTAAASSVAANLSAADMTITSGSINYQNGDDDGGTRIGYSGTWNTGNFDAAGKYLEFSVEPDSGYAFTLTNLTIRLGRTETGPTAFTLHDSADGFDSAGTEAGSGSITSELANALDAFTLADLPAGAQTGMVTFRIWGHNASGTGNLRFNNFRVFGTVSAVDPDPAITIEAGALAFDSVAVGETSDHQSYSVSGSDLEGHITITAPTGFEISTTAESSYGGTVVLAAVDGTVSETVLYVRFVPTLLGAYSGTITHESDYAATVDKSLGGFGHLAAPANAAASAISGSGFTAGWDVVSGAENYRLDVSRQPLFRVTDPEVTLAGWDFNDDQATPTAGLDVNTNHPLTTTASGTLGYIVRSGSNRAASVTGWQDGAGVKYWRVDFNTEGMALLNVSSVQRSSGTGPRDFKLQYRLGSDGAWADVDGGAVSVADNYATGVLSGIELPAMCEDRSAVALRWIMTGDTAVNNAAIASGGSSAIDDILIAGSPIVPAYEAGYEYLAVDGTDQVVAGLDPYTVYYFRVRAVHPDTTGPYSVTIPVTTAAAGPFISASPSTLNYFSAVVQAPSAEQRIGLDAWALTGAVTVAAPEGFEVSTTRNAGYGHALTLAPDGGELNVNLYARLSGAVIGFHAGEITIGGGGAETHTVAVAGRVHAPGHLVDFEPASSGSKTAYATGTVSLNGSDWTLTEALIGSVDGDKKFGARALRMRRSGDTAGLAEMQTDTPHGIGTVSFHYARFGTASPPALYVEYSTTGGASWTQAGDTITAGSYPDALTPWSVPLNQTGHTRVRLRTGGDGTDQHQLNIDDLLLTHHYGPLESEPTAQATALTFDALLPLSVEVSWSPGNGTGRLVMCRADSAPADVPVDGVAYTADANLRGGGSEIGGGKVVYTGSGNRVVLSGLSPRTTYHLRVFEHNGAYGTLNYLTTEAAGNPAVVATPRGPTVLPGNVLVFSVDGEIATPGSAATQVLIQEYTPDGTLVNMWDMPSGASGTRLTAVGNTAFDGKLSVSPNGAYAAVIGYDAPKGTTSVATTASRAIARMSIVDGAWDFSTSGLLGGGGNARAIAVDGSGSNLWSAVGGDGQGLRSHALGDTTAGTLLTNLNVRGVQVIGNQLYAWGAAGDMQGLYRVGDGLPTAGTPDLAGLTGISGDTGLHMIGFFMADLSDTVAGYDTLWMARHSVITTIGVTKYSKVGGTWTENNTISNTVVHIDGMVVDGTAHLFVIQGTTAGSTRLMHLADDTGYNQPMTGTFTELAVAGAYQAFRGVAAIPADADADGLPDWWELGWFGDIDTVDPETDYSGSGVTALQAYWAGTDPTDPDDTMRIVGIDLAAADSDDVTIAFRGGAGRVFRIRAATDSQAPKSAIGTVITAVAGTNTWTDSGAVQDAPRRFYELAVEHEGGGYTNTRQWAVFNQPRAAGRQSLVCVPVNYPDGGNTLNATLGAHLARGLYASDAEGEADKIRWRDGNGIWVEYFLSQAHGWTQVELGAPADVELPPGMAVWVVRGSGAAARDHAVFAGPVVTPDQAAEILFPTNAWTAAGWPLPAPGRARRDDTSADQLGFTAATGGTRGELDDPRSGDQLWIWRSTGGWDRYWLADNGDPDHPAHRRWYRSTGASPGFADITLQPGDAFYYFNSTNRPEAVPFDWSAQP